MTDLCSLCHCTAVGCNCLWRRALAARAAEREQRQREITAIRREAGCKGAARRNAWVQAHKRPTMTPEQARENGRKGGLAAAAKRRGEAAE